MRRGASAILGSTNNLRLNQLGGDLGFADGGLVGSGSAPAAKATATLSPAPAPGVLTRSTPN
jgi:hypothetical protein